MQLFIPKLQTVIRSDLMRDLTVGAGCSVQMLLLQWTINDNGIVNIHSEHHPRKVNEALFTSNLCPLSSQGRLSLLEPSWSASCGSWATCPQLIAFTQIWSCHLSTLSSTKMSKAFCSGDSAHVITQSKETAHPEQRYKPLNTWVREAKVKCASKTWKRICQKFVILTKLLFWLENFLKFLFRLMDFLSYASV